jgi:hypothetical protein
VLDPAGGDDEDVVGFGAGAVDALAGGVARAPGERGDRAEQRVRRVAERGGGAQDVEVGVLRRWLG